MIVTFYKTKLSANNRCYDGTAYVNYLNSIKAEDKKEVDLEYDIIPNSNFYLPLVSANNQWQLYNYITFEYAGLKYGSFILSIQPLATDGTIEIRHTTDNWYYVMVNGLNVDFHGQCVRAHVNDLVHIGETSTRVPYFGTDMTNTLLKPEENAGTSCFDIHSYDIIPPTIKKGTSTEIKKHLRYIYVYINSPTQTGLTITGNKQYMYTNLKEDSGDNYRYTALYGYLAVGVIDQDGNICFYSGTADSTTGLDFTKYTTTLIKLQSDVITKICVTDIPPNNDTELDLYLNQPYIKTTVAEFSNADFSVELQNNGFPAKIQTIPVFVEKKITILKLGDYDFNFASDVYTDNYAFSGLLKQTYGDYFYSGIAKLKSSPYNVITLMDRTIEFSKFNIQNGLNVYLQMSPDLSNVWCTFDKIDNMNKKATFSSSICLSNFDNVVKKSYFDVADLAVAGLNAQKKVTNAGFDVANAAISTVSSFVGGMTNPKKLASSVVSTVQGGVNTSRAVVNLDYTKKIEDITLEKTKGQINNGSISSNTPTGFYSSSLNLPYATITIFRPNWMGEDIIGERLHRYGYNTVLQLDQVYKHHKRQNFNYIQTEDCDVNGVPLDIANDIEEMFNSGVHLWSGEVEKWDVPNWQENLRQWYDTSSNNVEVQNV